MKILIRENKIIGTATDEYQGPEDVIIAPEDFDAAVMDQYQIIDGQIVPKIPEAITMRQARLVLLQQGILDDVETAINAIEDETTKRAVQIEWEYALDIRRDWPALNNVATSLGWTSEFVDDLFIAASKL